MIVRTEAVVLRAMKYGETSIIASLFTREHGRISAIAKGARLPRSRFGSTLQPMSHIQAVYYFKPGRSLQVLSDASHIELYNGTARNLDKMGAGIRMIELIGALLQEGEHNPSAFNLLIRCLETLDRAGAEFRNVLPFFQLKLAGLLGFAPDIEKEEVMRIGEAGGYLVLENGAVVPREEAYGAGRPASRAALRAFSICARARLDDVMRLELEPATRTELYSLADAYLRYHFTDSFPTRAGRVLGRIMGGESEATPEN